MVFKTGQNPHHPAKGSAIRVDPIRDINAIARIKRYLEQNHKLRDLCLFTLGVNTAWRANELLSIKVRQVQGLDIGDMVELKQSKTGKYRRTPLNGVSIHAINLWLAEYEAHYPRYFKPEMPLFPSKRYNILKVPSLTALVKKWCEEASIKGHFGSHTMRKTWAYHQRATFGSPLMLIMKALGHTSEEQTLAYIGILPEEIDDLYQMEL